MTGIFFTYSLLRLANIHKIGRQASTFPPDIARQWRVALPELCVFFASIAYGTTLYYTPVYFAFAHQDNAFDAAKHLLPFIGVFIAAMLVSGYPVKMMSHPPLLIIAGAALLTIGAGLQLNISADSSINSVMGYEAVIGAGVGLMWQTALAMSPEVLSVDGQIPHEDRMDTQMLGARRTVRRRYLKAEVQSDMVRIQRITVPRPHIKEASQAHQL